MTAAKILSSQSLFKEIEALITIGYKSLTIQTTKLQYNDNSLVVVLPGKLLITLWQELNLCYHNLSQDELWDLAKYYKENDCPLPEKLVVGYNKILGTYLELMNYLLQSSEVINIQPPREIGLDGLIGNKQKYESQKVISLYDKTDKTMLSADIKAEIISQIEGQTGLKLSGKNERQLKMIADNNDDLKEIIITFKAESSKATYKLKTIKNAIYLMMALRCHN
jgi:hypothetical protein